MKPLTAFLLLFSVFIICLAQGPSSERQQFIRVEAPVIALTHVRVIDGTGAAPLDDQTIVIADGKIQSIAPSATANCAACSPDTRSQRLHGTAGIGGDAQPHVLSAGRLAADVLEHGEQLSASLSRAWRHHDSHHRQRGAVYRSGNQEAD